MLFAPSRSWVPGNSRCIVSFKWRRESIIVSRSLAPPNDKMTILPSLVFVFFLNVRIEERRKIKTATNAMKDSDGEFYRSFGWRAKNAMPPWRASWYNGEPWTACWLHFLLCLHLLYRNNDISKRNRDRDINRNRSRKIENNSNVGWMRLERNYSTAQRVFNCPMSRMYANEIATRGVYRGYFFVSTYVCVRVTYIAN